MFSAVTPPPAPIDSRIKPQSTDIILVPPTNPYGGSSTKLSVWEMPAFETHLKLTGDRLAWLLDYAKTRIDEVALEMGRLEDGRVRPGSFLGVRMENQQTNDGDLDWRKALGGIFPTSNFSLEDNNRYARTLGARERDDLLSTRPCFAAMTTDEGDPELTKDAESFVQQRVDESNVIETLRDSIRVANVINEAVIKTTYLKKTTSYYGPATVMVDRNGLPMITPRGFYIYAMDDFIEDPTTQGLLYLQKDPEFKIPMGQGRYQRFDRLKQTTVHYDNVHAQVIDPRDFLCPLKVCTTAEADINVHLYETTSEDLRARYPNVDVSNNYFLRRRAAQTGAKQPKRMSGEEEERASRVVDTVLVAETYLRCPIHADQGDYSDYEIMLVFDLREGEPIFYDYLDNHMSRRPFSVIPGIERIPGRWHSIGVYTRMRNPALYIDAQFNRINEKDSQNAAVTYYHEDASEAWRAGAPFSPGSRTPIRVRTGWDPRVPICGRINLQADANLGLDMLNMRRQASDQYFSVLSGRDASAVGLNASKTATGVMSVERDANVISKDTEVDLVRGIEDQLEITVELVLDNMNGRELLARDGGKTLATLNREEIRALPRRVKMLLTKTRSAEMLATSEKAEAIWMRYIRLTPYEKYVGRPLYMRQLKGLEVDDADRLLPEVSKDESDAFLKAQQEQHGTPPPASESISIPYKDLARSEQVQILSKQGIQPASDSEIAKKQASDAALKVLEKSHGSPQHAIQPTPINPGGAGSAGLAA